MNPSMVVEGLRMCKVETEKEQLKGAQGFFFTPYHLR